MPDTRRDRAVVLGGSVAGLLAARVLADAYAEVVIVERDELSHAATHRRGVPQSRHIHGLLARGQQALEELFDGLTAELVDLGAPAGDVLEGIRAYFGGHRLQPGRSGPAVGGLYSARQRAAWALESAASRCGRPRHPICLINGPRHPVGVLPMTSTRLIIAALMVPVLVLIALVAAAAAAVVHWL